MFSPVLIKRIIYRSSLRRCVTFPSICLLNFRQLHLATRPSTARPSMAHPILTLPSRGLRNVFAAVGLQPMTSGFSYHSILLFATLDGPQFDRAFMSAYVKAPARVSEADDCPGPVGVCTWVKPQHRWSKILFSMPQSTQSIIEDILPATVADEMRTIVASSTRRAPQQPQVLAT